MLSSLREFADRRAGALLCLPACLLLALFVLAPFLSAVWDSFSNQSLKTILEVAPRQWVGLKNYAGLGHDPDFFQSLRNTLLFVAMVVPLQCLLALGMALLVNGASVWQRFLRVSFFAPVIMSMAVLSVLWGLLYNPEFGLWNRVLALLGVRAQPFLTSPSQALWCIALMSIWQGAGYQMMLLLAGLQNIPAEFYECARVEGADRWQQFWLITLPQLRNTVVLVVTITTILAFKLFVQPYLLTNGGPEGATSTLILQFYREAFTYHDFGRSSALVAIFFLLVVAAALLQRKYLPEDTRA